MTNPHKRMILPST